MSQTITATHERVDDIPAIIAHLKKMRVAELSDTHFPTNGNWEGLSLGWTTVVWLAFLLSEGDHRLYRVEPCAELLVSLRMRWLRSLREGTKVSEAKLRTAT